jgi:hypothetical protein
MQNAKCKMQNAKCKMQNAKCKVDAARPNCKLKGCWSGFRLKRGDHDPQQPVPLQHPFSVTARSKKQNNNNQILVVIGN